MKNKKRNIIIGLSLSLFVALLIVIINRSFAVPLESGARVAPNSDLTYYIDVIYDGKDAKAVSSSDTVTANVSSDYIYVEDKLPDGLTFKEFVTTSDGTIGAVKRSDGTSCPGYVVGDSAGLVYDSATRTVSFKVKNLQAGCKLTVGVVTTTPDLPNGKRLDFYNTAFARENDFSFKSNTVHVFMGDEEATLYTVTYKYTGTVPDGAPVPTTNSYSAGTTVGVEANPTVAGYTFSGWSTSNVTVTNNSFTMPSSNVVFTGSFTAKTKYTVTYSVSGNVPDGFISPTPKSYGAGDDVIVDSLKAGDVINGYRFLGWTSTDVSLTDGIFQMPSKNVSITGKFELIKYNVSYQFQGSVMPSNADSLLPATVAYAPGETITVADDPVATGYKFLGWYKSKTFEMPEEDVVIYGEWMLFSGYFSPTITITIPNKKASYKKGEVVPFQITVTNTASIPIKDVMVQEYLTGATFTTSTSYTLLSDQIVKIGTIAAGASVTLNATFTATDKIVADYVNSVEITGALADNYYYLDTSQDYKVSVAFKVANVALKVNLTDSDDGTVLSDGKFSLYSNSNLSDASKVAEGLEFTDLIPGTTYYLKQTRVQTGYVLLPDTYTVVVDTSGNITFKNQTITNTTGVVTVDLVNDKIDMLPNTGGVGNIPYIVGGFIVIVCASCGYVLYMRRKMEGM